MTMKIGEFSKLFRVSVRMLRHYDDIGLLKPVEIDHFTGYRYYEASQLRVQWRVRANTRLLCRGDGVDGAEWLRMLRPGAFGVSYNPEVVGSKTKVFEHFRK